ncbi:MAG: hypothetical protein N3H30_01850 [Candidatus Micrarchaeota archaeon]|nr:hypothetical protein [Candidatus Micrarchaeota archaeon]
MKSLKPEKMANACAENPARAFKCMFEKAAQKAKAVAGAAALGAALALAPSCAGKADLGPYEATDSIEVPDADALAQCVPNTKAAYRALLSVGGEELKVGAGSRIMLGDAAFTVSFKDDGTLVLTDERGKPYEVGDGAYVNGVLVEVADRSTDLLAYESRVLASIGLNGAQSLAIISDNYAGTHKAGNVDVELKAGPIESWDNVGDYVPVSVKASVDGKEYGVAGTLSPTQGLSVPTPAGEIAVSAREFIVEQFPSSGVDACDRTRVVAYVAAGGSDIQVIDEGGTITLSNGMPVKVEKVFPTVGGKVAAVELSWRDRGEPARATLAAGETLTVTSSNEEASVQFLGAAFRTETE